MSITYKKGRSVSEADLPFCFLQKDNPPEKLSLNSMQ